MATSKKTQSASSSSSSSGGGGGAVGEASGATTSTGVVVSVVPLIHDSLTFGSRQTKGLKEMERQAEAEMKRKRREWEREVDRMREEFLRLYPVDEDPGQGQGPQGHPPQGQFVARRRGSTDVLDEKKMQTLITDHPDSDRKFRLRFDLSGFDLDDVEVYTDSDRIVVRSSRLDITRGGGGVLARRRFGRKIQRPKGVDPDKLQSHLTTDGILVIEAVIASKQPPPPPDTPHRRHHHHHHHHHHHNHPHRRSSAPSPPFDGPLDAPPTNDKVIPETKVGVPVFKDESGRRRLLLVVEVGKVFRPKDVTIQVIKDNRLIVKARHEDINSERLVKGKFSKEFELAERIETDSVRGGIDGEGKLVVGAFVKGHAKDTAERQGSDDLEELSLDEFDPKPDLHQCNVLDLSSFPPTMPASASASLH